MTAPPDPLNRECSEGKAESIHGIWEGHVSGLGVEAVRGRSARATSPSLCPTQNSHTLFPPENLQRRKRLSEG